MECENCGTCCGYITINIASPKNEDDFDEIRWYLSHENIWIYIDEEGWNMQVNNICKYRKNGKCSDYENRSNICRNYSANHCEKHEEDKSFTHLFKNPEELNAYLKKITTQSS